MGLAWLLAAVLLAAACGPGAVDTDGVAWAPEGGCAECHAPEHRAWRGSHHDLAMQRATPATVLGDFDDARFTHGGVISRFFRRDGRYFVRTEGADGQPADFELTHTFGVDPLQQYLAPFPGGRLQSLSIAWDTARGAWFHLYPDEQIPPGDALHWSGRYQTWNAMCAECHSTNLGKGYDAASDSYRTVWDALDVGCQACHGPGARHVAWARAGPSEPAADATAAGLVVDLGGPHAATEVQACAGCHAHRRRLGAAERPGRPFLDDFQPSTLRAGLYYPDGQIRDEVYVWGSFAQSRMQRAGVRCSNCHEPHGLGLRAEGDGLCLQCHRETPPARFPSLEPRRYDTPAHHFHPPDSPGAACVNCHMPARTYMVIDARRDHSFRVPRPDLSVALGTPNACTACHTGETDAWAAARAAEWWGPPGPHFATVLAAARRGDPSAKNGLRRLAADAGQPPIVRATALEHLPQYGPGALASAVAATTDPEPLVRMAAAAALERLAPRARLAALTPLLGDPLRAVRIEAARALTAVPRSMLDGPDAARFDAALAELAEAQAAAADLPAGQLEIGVVARRRGDVAAAETAFRRALRLDAALTPARRNLASLLSRQGRNAEAETVLRAGLQRAPDEGELHRALGLLLAEEQRFEAAAASLERAAALLPDRARVRYNLGLVLQRLGRLDAADAALAAAEALDPRDADVRAARRRLADQRRQADRP